MNNQREDHEEVHIVIESNNDPAKGDYGRWAVHIRVTVFDRVVERYENSLTDAWAWAYDKALELLGDYYRNNGEIK